MKRFYCTICARVKRVRSYPQDITSQHSDVVSQRTGTCSRHSETPTIHVQKSDGQTAFTKAVNVPVRSTQNKRRA